MRSKKRGQPKLRHGGKKKGRQNKYPEEMAAFIRKHMQDYPNNELVTLIKREFKIRITYTQLAAYMHYKKITRKNGAVKEWPKKEKELRTLPPEEY